MAFSIKNGVYNTTFLERTDDSSTAMNIDGSSSSKTFRIDAPTGSLYCVSGLKLVTSDGYSTGWDKDYFLGITSTLTNGLQFKYHNTDTVETYWTVTVKDNLELFSKFPKFHYSIDTNVRLLIFDIFPRNMYFLGGSIMIDEDRVFDVIVQDNLTALTSCECNVNFCSM